MDTAALIAAMRRGDEAARTEAYRTLFGSELGRFVLMDIAASAGVGGKWAGASDPYSLGHHYGGHDYAIDILNVAGFDAASIVNMIITQELEGRDDDPSSLPYAEPDPDFGDGA
jgi:hypothetical protein